MACAYVWQHYTAYALCILQHHKTLAAQTQTDVGCLHFILCVCFGREPHMLSKDELKATNFAVCLPLNGIGFKGTVAKAK